MTIKDSYSKLIEKWKKRLERFKENPHIADGMNSITSMGVQHGRTKCLRDCIKELEELIKEQESPYSKEVNIKEELENLDRNDFITVCELVDKIIFDLMDILMNDGDEVVFGAARDYMIDLINPNLLRFNEESDDK